MQFPFIIMQNILYSIEKNIVDLKYQNQPRDANILESLFYVAKTILFFITLISSLK